jgi:hypothetical protein
VVIPNLSVSFSQLLVVPDAVIVQYSALSMFYQWRWNIWSLII